MELDKEHPAVVYDLAQCYGLGDWVDRRTMPRKMSVDVDLRDPDKRNGMWIYWGSGNTIRGALQSIRRGRKQFGEGWEVRLLDNSDYTVIIQVTIEKLLRLI